jgi:hypothetical protein
MNTGIPSPQGVESSIVAVDVIKKIDLPVGLDHRRGVHDVDPLVQVSECGTFLECSGLTPLWGERGEGG